jgi:D-cysteine desulfhydrase family pyridoxal phosphate-dependent enzyme
LEPLERLSDMLGVELWVKRDDLTGLALGGNKVRKLEFLMADAMARRADVVITTGGTQSNHARLTAAACRKLGLACHLVLDRGRHPENGNLLLDQLFDAEIEIIEDPDPAAAAARMTDLAAELTREGLHPYVIPRGGSVPMGAAGYFNMVDELSRQLGDLSLAPACVYVATGSCGTHSGVMAGRAFYRQSWAVRGISVSRGRDLQEEKIIHLSGALLELLGASQSVQASDVTVDDRFTGGAYGVPTPETWEAVELLARSEGIVLDPVYTGKAMAGLLGHIRSGHVAQGTIVVFVHTGGAPALFGYASEMPAGI